jgi:hypothetical protein
VKYALLIYTDPAADHDLPPAEGAFANWVDYTRALNDAGSLLGAEHLLATETATTVRIRAGEQVLTDGPFAETTEHLLGFYLIDVSDIDAALDWAVRMPASSFCSIELRPVSSGALWQEVMNET